MSEWWTYSLSDFLMFSARTYYRQFALMNRELWPLPLLGLALGALILACMLRKRPAGQGIAFALAALAWLWVGWNYHLQRYAHINMAAPYLAGGFFLQAGLLAWMAWKRPAEAAVDGAAAWAAAAGVLLALAAYPLLAALEGRDWWQAEVVFMAPDPTVAATLAILLHWRARWPFWVIPLLWCAASTATLSALRSPHAWVPAAFALPAAGGALMMWAAARTKRTA